jgi:hypothetical protein
MNDSDSDDNEYIMYYDDLDYGMKLVTGFISMVTDTKEKIDRELKDLERIKNNIIERYELRRNHNEQKKKTARGDSTKESVFVCGSCHK